MNWKHKTVIGLAGVVLLAGGGVAIDQQLNAQALASEIPLVSGVSDSKGVTYGTKSKDLSPYQFNQEESYLAQAVLDGNGPNGLGTMSPDNIMKTYYSIAIKMGLTSQDIAKGINLYDFIRK